MLVLSNQTVLKTQYQIISLLPYDLCPTLQVIMINTPLSPNINGPSFLFSLSILADLCVTTAIYFLTIVLTCEGQDYFLNQGILFPQSRKRVVIMSKPSNQYQGQSHRLQLAQGVATTGGDRYSVNHEPCVRNIIYQVGMRS
jgi:hypothetical protein